MGNAVSNPKTMYNSVYFAAMMFGAFHLTRLSVTLLQRSLLGRFGKPQLVRETSKIHTSNYALVPWMYAKKFVTNNVLRHSEENLLKGVILDKQLED
jgi:ATPase family AAA domain-containing protein 3A/B